MSNEHYELFCRADLSGLTTLDRQVFGHYCQRFNENVVPPHAWPGIDELLRITGVKPKSISRSLGRLNNGYSLLIRVTLASKTHGKRAEYAINLPLLRSLSQVTEQLPKSKDVTQLQVTDEAPLGNREVPVSNPAVSEMEPYGYPKPIKPNKPINVKINYERWNVVISSIDENTRKLIDPAPNTELLLDKLTSKGWSIAAIRDAVGRVNYWPAGKVGGLFVRVLQDLAGVKPAPKTSSMPPWCGNENCDSDTRSWPEASLINGVLTHNCPKCHPLMQGERRTTVEPENLKSVLANFLKSPD